MFTTNFLNINASQIVQEIKENGFFALEGALEESFTRQMLGGIDFNQILLNANDTGVVTANNIKYLTHCLANSQHAYNLITSPEILQICQNYFSTSYKLTNHRIYQTSRNQHMPWHTDNNTQKGENLTGKHVMPGLLYLFYLSDVTQNAFQFVKYSHKSSDQHSGERYLSNELVNQVYGKDIVSFKMKQGSLIICDTHGIHRAEPYKDRNYTRTTLLFQVDEVGDNHEGHGEKNLVNTEFLKNLTPQLMDYLGFGFDRNYPAFPITSIGTLPLPEILKVQKQIFSKTLYSGFKNLVKTLLPGEAMVAAKRLQWHLRSNKKSDS